MPHRRSRRSHSQLFGQRERLGDDLTTRAWRMAPRDPNPLPEEIPWKGPPQDFGAFLPNLSTAAAPYSHGLSGVNQSANWTFAHIIIASFFGILLVTLLYRWTQMARAHLRHMFTMGRSEDQRYWMYNHSHFWPRIKRHIIYAPLFRQRHNREIQLSNAISIGTLPSRYHTILLFLYVASNIAYSLALNWGRGDRYAVIAELRGRTGMLAALNVIPAVLFALRNNPLIPLLGVSYDTFNLLHRWTARVLIFEAVVHTVCWAVNSIESGGQEQLRLSLRTSMSYRWGMIASCTFGLIFVTAFGPVRHAFYETFLNVHRLLVVFALIGVYVHLDTANLPQLPYVQLAMAFWVAEWVWRSVRIIYHNFSRKHGITQITVEALPAEACRVTFDLSRPWRWQPGCHVHAYLPAFALWSSHPFSIAWAENRSRDEPPQEMEMEEKPSVRSNSLSQAPSIAFSPNPNLLRPGLIARPSTFSKFSKLSGANTIATVAEITHKPESANIALSRDAGVTSVSLVTRARTGMTKRLYEKAVAAPSGTITTWGAIEGPYGGHESMASYGTVVLFAGGVGITHCIGYVHHLMLQYQAGTSSTQKILLVWSVPNTEALEWVRRWMDSILKMEGRREVLRIQLFISKPRHRAEVISSTGSVQMFPGRCNPKTIVEKEMQERIGAMAVAVCGPGAFGDAVRAAVRDVVEDGVIDFVEESFSY